MRDFLKLVSSSLLFDTNYYAPRNCMNCSTLTSTSLHFISSEFKSLLSSLLRFTLWFRAKEYHDWSVLSHAECNTLSHNIFKSCFDNRTTAKLYYFDVLKTKVTDWLPKNHIRWNALQGLFFSFGVLWMVGLVGTLHSGF